MFNFQMSREEVEKLLDLQVQTGNMSEQLKEEKLREFDMLMQQRAGGVPNQQYGQMNGMQGQQFGQVNEMPGQADRVKYPRIKPQEGYLNTPEMIGTLENTVYLQSAADARQLSYVEIDTETGKITPSLIDVDNIADEDILQTFQEEEDACQKWLDLPLGSTNVDLRIPDEYDARLHKSQVITFLNMVCNDRCGTQLSANALFLRAKGFEKQITMRDLVSTYVFPNTLVVKQIDGKTLKEYLERCAQFWDVENGKIKYALVLSDGAKTSGMVLTD